MNYGELNFDELKTLAENGDVGAMVTLADVIREYHISKNNLYDAWIQSLPWYERAGSQGDASSVFMALDIHDSLCSVKKASGNWIELEKECAAVTRCIVNLVSLIGPEIFNDEEINLPQYRDRSRYYRAVAYDRQGRHEEAYTALKDMGNDCNPIVPIFLAHVLIGLKRYDEIYDTLRFLEESPERVLTAGYDPDDENIKASGFIYLSIHYRSNIHDEKRAYEVLQNGLNIVKTEDARSLIRDEIGHYKQKMFGGYEYRP